MTTLRHPNIYPPLEIEVADACVKSHLQAGWLLAEDAELDSTPNDHAPTGEDQKQE